MTSADWATVASLATALGTLVLAVATFNTTYTRANVKRQDAAPAGTPRA